MHLMNTIKRDSLKDEDLQSLVRLCGKSMLYLPSEYAPCSLVLPTCFRATAQYLVQHAADTQGVFRIPGSIRVVNALYDYYCADGNADEISSTIRCPNLPPHIKASTHDVASTFKRLLAGIPGGILGSLSLFDALVAIHSQLKGDPEFPRTKQTKLRARLMALAIGTVRSQFRRELISAVFGLLCLIGRAAENTPREDEQGRPLPTADLMGYNALGIVFGPLLVGDLINAYTMRLANPDAGLVLFPVTPPNAKRERRKSKAFDENHPRSLSVDKIHVANGIAEMLIIHWREVVKHMKSLEVLKIGRDGPDTLENQATKKAGLRPSTSESFVIRKPTEWSSTRDTSRSFGRGDSPIPPSPTPEARRGSGGRPWRHGAARSALLVQRQRPKISAVRSSSQNRVCTKGSMPILSPTAEEPTHTDSELPKGHHAMDQMYGYPPPAMHFTAAMEEPRGLRENPPCRTGDVLVSSSNTGAAPPPCQTDSIAAMETTCDIPAQREIRGVSPSPTVPRRRLVVSKDSIRFTNNAPLPTKSRRGRPSQASGRGRVTSSDEQLGADSMSSTAKRDGTSRGSVGLSRSPTKHRRAKQSSQDRKSQSANGSLRLSRDTKRPMAQGIVNVTTPAAVEDKTLRDDKPRTDISKQKRSRLAAWRSKHRATSTGTESSAPRSASPHYLSFRSRKSHSGSGSSQGNQIILSEDPLAPVGDQIRPGDVGEGSVPRLSRNHIQGEHPEELGRKTPAISTPQQSPRKSPEKRSVDFTPASSNRLRPVKSVGSAVKAMAAMFESASKDESSFVPTPMQKISSLADLKPSGVLAQYTVNPPSPSKSPARSPTKSARSQSAHSSQRSCAPPVVPLRRSQGSAETILGTSRRTSSSDHSLNASNTAASAGTPQQMEAVSPGKGGSAYSTRAHTPVYTSRSNTPTLPEQHRRTESSPPLRGRSEYRGSLPKESESNTATATSESRPSHTPVRREPSIPGRQWAASRSPSFDPGLQQTEDADRLKTLALHAQIRALQRQLEVRTEEVNHLRRELDAQKDADFARLREQVIRTERECAMWRERAERAERRVRMFERVAKAARARYAASVAGSGDGAGEYLEGYLDDYGDEEEGGEAENEEEEEDGEDVYDEDEEGVAVRKDGERKTGSSTSYANHADEGVEEEKEEFTKRMRRAFRGMNQSTQSSAGIDDEVMDMRDGGDGLYLTGGSVVEGGHDVGVKSSLPGDYRSSMSDGEGNLSITAVNMWMAAEEIFSNGEGTG
ncbi:putative Rho-GTPase-activating protein [Cladorrhinum samala]|uniref:Rho-GTPase-activating protein n=1 Tax=Cladorrhinum samala TaxID=585594 RepID=A0AAV9HH72_9PEZI|nr:putative Rho-GTPase-activating protein [Cladorrhinum samala]